MKDEYDWAEAFQKAGHDPGEWYSTSDEEKAIFKQNFHKTEVSLPDVPYYKCHPSGVQPKDVSQHHTYNVGTAITYLMRSPYKHGDPYDDIRKARDHLEFELDKLKS